MNRRRNEPRTPVMAIFAVIFGCMIAASGGVLYAYFKNAQIRVAREIDAVEKRIEQYRYDIRTVDMRKDELLNRFALRKQLEESGSRLQPIALADVEEIETAQPRSGHVAYADH